MGVVLQIGNLLVMFVSVLYALNRLLSSKLQIVDFVAGVFRLIKRLSAQFSSHRYSRQMRHFKSFCMSALLHVKSGHVTPSDLYGMVSNSKFVCLHESL